MNAMLGWCEWISTCATHLPLVLAVALVLEEGDVVVRDLDVGGLGSLDEVGVGRVLWCK